MSISGSRENAHLQSLEVLYRRYSVWLTGQVRQRGWGYPPEDLVQETFARLASRSSQYSLEHPTAFLLEVAHNLVINRLKSAAAVKNSKPADDPIMGYAAAGADQFESLFLNEIVLSLPQSYRDVFVLSRFDGMTNAQIAAACQLTEKAVERRLSKALAICAAKMRD